MIILELLGFRISISDRRWKIFAYYTQISNLITLVSSSVFLLTDSAPWLRYTSACMLTMTFVVTACILAPFGGGYRNLMLSGNGLYHHTLCPILSVSSYLFWEPHSSAWGIPVIITFVYGIIMLAMNWKGRFDGKKLKVRKRGGKEHPDDDMVRLFINIGKKQHVKPGDILGAIAGEAGISGRLVGAIDLGESFSFVDVDRKNADKVMRAMKNVKIRGLNVHMEKANGEK